ncbi:MAG: arabinose-5-phosphate isomerase [Bacteroidetes bacterium]|nr:MAG: arabinose-5-phosphate isomerase [Bacteroidota bacterium]
MKTNSEIIQIASQVINNEINALAGLLKVLGNEFAEAVKLILACEGKVIVSGVGKSATIAQKMVATFNSTGTTAVFLHAADAIHGDLGVIRDEDIIILLSKSGETPEIRVLIPLLKARKNKLISIVGNTQSYLALQSDVALDSTVPREACPNNLAPTASTTAQLVIGDALAVCLLECRGFTAEDFAKVHPGGALGKQLYLRVDDIFLKNQVPFVGPEDDLTKIIVEISAKRLGATAVLDHDILLGIITDGDLRRMLINNPRLDQIKASDIMTKNPKHVEPGALVVDALETMRRFNITQLPVVEAGKYKGVIHLHDIIKEGII